MWDKIKSSFSLETHENLFLEEKKQEKELQTEVIKNPTLPEHLQHLKEYLDSFKFWEKSDLNLKEKNLTGSDIKVVLEYLHSIDALKFIKEISIGFNLISKIHDSTFINCSNVESLYMWFQNTPITQLWTNDLKWLWKLEYLHLYGIWLEQISSSIFSDLTQLRSIDFSNNNLETVSPEVFNMSKDIREVSFVYNELNEFHLNPDGSYTINKLKLTGNNLSKENILQLAKNNKIKHIQYNQNPWIDEYIPSHKKITNKSSYSNLSIPNNVLKKEQYQKRSHNDPLTLIQHLEDSRKKYDKNSETKHERKWTLPTRQEIVNYLSPHQLVSLLTTGNQEVLSGYESTFGIIYDTLLAKDPELKILDTMSWVKAWSLLSTVTQMIPRYLHLRWAHINNINFFFKKVWETNIIEKLAQSGVFTIDTTITYIIPIIMMYKSLVDQWKSRQFQPFSDFFQKFCTNTSQYFEGKEIEIDKNNIDYLQKENVWSFKKLRRKIFKKNKKWKDTIQLPTVLTDEQMRKSELVGLLMYQLADIDPEIVVDEQWNDISFSEEEKQRYELDMAWLESLTFDWSPDHPWVTHMFFDNDIDWIRSFTSWLWTMWLSWKNKHNNVWWVSYSKNLVLGNKKEESYYRIDASKNWQILHSIYANHPKHPWWVKYFQWTPDIVVDRGHAWNEEAWLEAISASTKLVLIWSCGGYVKLADALSKNIDIQYIWTTGTWYANTNNAILMSIIHAWVNWKPMERNWWKPEKRFISDKEKFNNQYKQYQLPDKQIATRFRKKYEELVSNFSSEDFFIIDR